jgi:hypothetical protein
MGWIETAKEKGREHIISVVFALIALLLSIIWLAVPSEVWGKASAVVPKRVLWALLGLAVIAISLETALFLDYRRGSKHTPTPYKPKRMLGVLWDEEFNPVCPVCEILLHMFYINADSNRPRQALRCPKCKAEYTLLDDEGHGHALLDVKEYLSGKSKRLF